MLELTDGIFRSIVAVFSSSPSTPRSLLSAVRPTDAMRMSLNPFESQSVGEHLLIVSYSFSDYSDMGTCP
jgi:hypothetical protein